MKRTFMVSLFAILFCLMAPLPAMAVGEISTNQLANGVLAASTAGRLKMAANFFDAATLTAKIANDAITAAVFEAKFAAGAISATVDGHAAMADDYFTTAEFIAGAGGKFAPACLDNTAIANVVADNAFTAAEFAAGAGGKFAPDALVEAGIDNLIADDAITAAIWEAKAAVGAISATADGHASLADDFFTTAEMIAGAGGKFAPSSFDATAVTNVFAAASWTAVPSAAAVSRSAVAAPRSSWRMSCP
mgnify:CR=1 FL=1